MKRIILWLLCCVLLVACAPGTTDAPEPTVAETTEPLATATEAALPTLTPELTATSTAIPTTNPTATTSAPEATATTLPDSTPTVATTTDSHPEPSTAYPADLMITLRQEGGFTGAQLEWIIDSSGRVTQNGAEIDQLAPEEVAGLYQTLLDNNFFTLAPDYKAEEICCDFYKYTLTVTANAQTTSVITIGGPPDTPPWLWNCLQPILTLVGQVPAPTQ